MRSKAPLMLMEQMVMLLVFALAAAVCVALLMAFAVLCLTVFALLSLTTVRADVRLADASVQAVSDYYAADRAAQTILARLRGGEMPEGVTSMGGNLYAYSCPVSDRQQLEVEVEVDGTAYRILRWQTVPTGEWESDGSLEVWDGTLF